MSLLRHAIRSNFTINTLKPTQALPLCLRQSPVHLSSEAEQPPPTPEDSSSIDPFLQNTGDGRVYGKLVGFTKFALKTDIINLLDGSNLTPDDIKFNYNRSFTPLDMMVQFPSRAAFDAAIRALGKKGRLYRLDRASRSEWDLLMPYDGKFLLIQGLPRNAIPEDVERFLSGCEYDSSSIQLFLRQGFPDPIKMALVRFHTRTEAMNALITKNRGFCLNDQVSVRVLQ